MLRPWHYSLVLDKASPHSIHQQLIEHFRAMIEGGAWLGGSALPSSRDIAQRLGINRKTVSRVYEELSAQGLIYTQPKRGTFVSQTPRSETPGPLRPRALIHTRPELDSASSSIYQLIQKTTVHHIRRVALHMHKLRPHDYDVTGLFNLKHMLANLLAHERRYLVSPDHITCGTWPVLQAALMHHLSLADGCLLLDHRASIELERSLVKHGIQVLRLPDIADGQAHGFIEQVEKYCINYPVSALWCDTSTLFEAQTIEGAQALVAQKLADYRLLLIDDQRSHLPFVQQNQPLSSRYAKSILLGSLYGECCDMFNLCYLASNLGFSSDFINELNVQQQQSSLLNMLAQSELIKRGEYKKLLTTIHRFLQQT
ncbi:GntR family transcriptional regulator [Methylophilus sp. OH31]|uniref:GntR family transcriptional regulator n=1 Tax=Methylophilus sp. OH31 TaxID=1387312 RepID=UPI0004B27C4C|nr:GntR family transcriptional regulator [Methylophilus sp. OH31]